MCPFGVGCHLSGSQGGGISNSASRGKGDFPFPHEDRRDVTVWRLYVFYCLPGFSETPWPPFYSPCPLRRGKGEAQSGAGFGSGRLASGRLAAGRCPPFKGVGGFRNPTQTNLSGRLAAGRCPPFKGVGGGRNYFPNWLSGRPASGRCLQNV